MSKVSPRTDHELVRQVRVSSSFMLEGDLCVPENARGIVLFAHGSGSSRKSPRNQFVAGVIRRAG